MENPSLSIRLDKSPRSNLKEERHVLNGLSPNWLSQRNHRTRRLKTAGDNSARQILNLFSFVCFL